MTSLNLLRIPEDGYLVLPISMSRSNNSQSATACYNLLKQLQQQCSDPGMIDVIILYTTGLYFNNQNETAWEVKRRLTSQMISHKASLSRLMQHYQDLHFAIHFQTWEETVLDAPDYQHFYQKLYEAVKTDTALSDLAAYSIGNREINDASISFLVEETVVAHILRQIRVALPKTHVRKDLFRLLVYPGPYIAVDFYQWKKAILPQRIGIPFGNSQYNASTHELYTFDDMPLPVGEEWERELRITSQK